MNVAFIPVRGGSKSIPLKNIRILNGKPLVYWVTKAACECIYIDKVFISTEDDRISRTVEDFKKEIDLKCQDKIKIISRTKETASDEASTESAMLEFASEYEFDNIALIQATSPLLTADDLRRGFEEFSKDDVDSVLSVVRQKRFIWGKNEDGFFSANNYDIFNRPRRQDFMGFYVENGAFYICSRNSLIESHNRISGNISIVEMNEDSYFEIDEAGDLEIISALMKNRSAMKHNMPEIKLFLTDCDGCLTDGGMYYSEKGDELKKFNTRDGVGFSILRDKGIITGIITGECVELNKRRAEKLKLDIIEMGCADKLSTITDICNKYSISLQNVCYVGDDINDIEVMKKVGFGCAPADANERIKECARYVAKVRGGEGVIREIAEMIAERIVK